MEENTIKKSEDLVEKIQEDAEKTIQKILDAARAEAGRIISEAKKQAEETVSRAQGDAEKEVETYRQRLATSISLEERRIALEEKRKFADSVLASVQRLAREFRNSPAYQKFLQDAIVEAAQVIGDTVCIQFSQKDRATFSEEFTKKLIEKCKEIPGVHINLSFEEAEFDDIGIVARSPDSRVIFDNRFSARLGRMKDELYMKLIKEAFSDGKSSR